MSVTIMEALQNADYNLTENANLELGVTLARGQLHNAVVLLEKGYVLDDEIEPLLRIHGNVDNVPENEK